MNMKQTLRNSGFNIGSNVSPGFESTQTIDTDLILLIILALLLILIISVFIKPRVKPHYFVLSFFTVFPSIAVYELHPYFTNIDQILSGGFV